MRTVKFSQLANLLALLEIGEDVVLAGLDMGANDAHCRLDVALLDGFEQAQMFLMRCHAARRIVQTIGAPLKHNALEDMGQ